MEPMMSITANRVKVTVRNSSNENCIHGLSGKNKKRSQYGNVENAINVGNAVMNGRMDGLCRRL
jgi:hypothetical protein